MKCVTVYRQLLLASQHLWLHAQDESPQHLPCHRRPQCKHLARRQLQAARPVAPAQASQAQRRRPADPATPHLQVHGHGTRALINTSSGVNASGEYSDPSRSMPRSSTFNIDLYLNLQMNRRRHSAPPRCDPTSSMNVDKESPQSYSHHDYSRPSLSA